MFNFNPKIFTQFLLVCFCLQCFCQNNDNQVPKVGLVLSGGGAKGLAHIGVLKVLEKAGLSIDIIGGTSMGGIVGGLYAAGYNAEEIEKIALSQNWVDLLTDQIERANLSVKEKEDYNKYLITFPIEERKIKLPSGLGAGQNISLLLSKLMLPVSGIVDFSELPRPFLCIGTDIVTGDEIILDKGYLPDAIRASMAIPTLFTPVEIDGHLLVDGGLVNNLPVDRVIEKGAEIVIGVNLGLKDYNKEELENMAAVLEQSIFIHAKERNKQNQKLCRILIEPDVYKHSAVSFSNVADLIKIGEEAAMEHFDELKALADSINRIKRGYIVPHIKEIDSIYIEKMEITGLINVPEHFLRAKLNFSIPGKISVKDLNDGMQRAYGTQFFEKVTYKLTPVSNDHTLMTVRVEEKTKDFFRLGARYDSQFKTQLLLNATVRNKLIKGSKLTLDLNLGEFPRAVIEYRINTGWKPRSLIIFSPSSKFRWFPGFGVHIDARTFEMYNYNQDTLAATYKYTYFTSSLFASSGFTNAFYFETGISYEKSNYNYIFSENLKNANNDFLRLYAFIKQDNYDDKDFPNRGSSFIMSFEADEDPGFKSYRFAPIFKWVFKFENAVPLGKRITLIPRLNTGMVRGDSIPPDDHFFAGGSYEFGFNPNTSFQFNGLRFMQLQGRAAIIAGLRLQYEFTHNNYVLIDGNMGKVGDIWENLIVKTDTKLYYGAGIAYAYNSFIGPIKIGFYKTIENTTPWQVYINLGYWF